jgi:peptide-methionine (S)-S-oxide reductase
MQLEIRNRDSLSSQKVGGDKIVKKNDEIVVLGGGCFWCTEAVFSELNGVISVVSGYAGGHAENPTYRQVCGGQTGHAEVIEVQFDPGKITYKELLDVFFAIHDPTTLNRQGADEGTQYRSIILYTNQNQRDQSEEFIQGLNGSELLPSPVVTELAQLENFYEAEADHKQFYMNNPDNMYCQIVVSPKVRKVRDKFAAHLR